MKNFTLFAAIFVAAFMSSCSEDSNEDVNSGNNQQVSNTLHLSFKTPDWERNINCEHLDLYPISVNNTTSSVSAQSASTQETFYFTLPTDSTDMVKSSNIKKYAIAEYGGNDAPFEFSQKLPLNSGSSERLVSKAAFDENNYNEVTEINYSGSDSQYAFFKIKCKYKMTAYVVNNPAEEKIITGTFHFKVRTSKE